MALSEMPDPDEIWKPVPWLPDVFASSAGRVRRDVFVAVKADGSRFQTKPSRVLVGEQRANGYRAVAMRHDGKKARHYVHRLVCEAFHGPPPLEGATVDHLDGDKLNNAPSNLEWVSRTANVKRQHRDGRAVIVRGTANGKSKLTEANVRLVRMMLAQDFFPSEIADFFRVSVGAIQAIKEGRTWAHVE